jgi:hypothetical protein
MDNQDNLIAPITPPAVPPTTPPATPPVETPIVPEVRSGFEAPAKPADDDVDAEDEAKISKVVSRLTAPIQQQSVDNQNSLEAETFIRDNQEKYPFASKYRQAMLQYMKHPAYSRLPVANIFKIVAGDELIKFGAEQERVASTKANSTRTVSSSARQFNNGAKNWGNASKDEFIAKREEVLGRPS